MKNRLLIGICLILFMSCSPKYEPFSEVQWLVGTWEQTSIKGKVYENWKQIDAQTLTATSFKLEGTDTIVLEKIKLREENHQLFFIPTVPIYIPWERCEIAIESSVS